MRFRLVLVLLLAFVLGGADVLGPSIAGAQQSSGRGGEVASLKDQLEKGLRARRPEEFAFIAKVVSLVNEGRLPLSLVKSTFQWARRKQPYQMPYFQKALRIRAARIGVAIPPTEEYAVDISTGTSQ